MTRIFLSHSSRDSRQAIALKRWLVQQEPGFAGEIFLDIDPDTGIAPGVRWREALTRANARCEAVVCLLSTSWESSGECNSEYDLAEKLNKPIFCARLDGRAGGRTHEWQHCDLFGDGPTTEIMVDGEPIVFRTEGLRRLLRGLRDAGVGAEHFAWPPPGDPDRAPYRGWNPLEEQDAAIFFGRDTEIVGALDELRGMRASGTASLFVILGPSGTGKSSFLRAGLLPRLRRDDRHFVPLGIVRPERAALDGDRGLAKAIHTARTELGLPDPPLGEIKSACRSADVAHLRGWLDEIREAARDRLLNHSDDTPRPTLILPVDQAEELFSADAGRQATRFLELVPRLAEYSGDGEPPLIVIATIRSDRYEALQTSQALTDVRAVPFAELKPLPRTEFKEVIRGPAQRSTEAGRPLDIEPALVDRLLSACGQGADTLPLLALTLARLYQDYGSTGRLTLDEYTAMGGMHSVVQTEIDALLSPDPDERRAQLEHLRAAFIPWLATIDADTGQPLRRIALWSDLPAESRPLVDAMVGRRLLVKYERGGEVVVEVALESLLRQWRDLVGWLDDERGHLRDADVLERAAMAWRRNNRNDEWLLAGERLTDAEELTTLPGFRDRLDPVRPFLLASRKREDERIADDLQRHEAELRSAHEKQAAAEALAAAESDAKEKAQKHAAILRRRSKMLVAALAVAAVTVVLAATGLVRATNAEHRARTETRESAALSLIANLQLILDGSIPTLDDEFALQLALASDSLGVDIGTDYSLMYAAEGTRDLVKIIEASDAVMGVAVSPDGHRIASGNWDDTVQVWDAETGQSVGEPLTGHTGTVSSVAFGPDSHRLASGSWDGTVRIWNADTGQQIGEPLTGNENIVTSVAFSPDGRRLVSAGGDNTIRIWDTGTGQQVGEPLRGHTDAVTSVAFNSAGDRVASGSFDGTVRMWDAHTGQQIGAPFVGHGGAVASVALSPDGRTVASGGIDKTIRLWAADTGTPVREPLTGHTQGVNSVAFSPDGARIVSASDDKTLRLWDPVTGQAIGDAMNGHEWFISSVRFTPDGRHLVSASFDRTVRMWDPMPDIPLTGHVGVVTGVAVTPDGARIISSGEDGTVKLWDTLSRRQLRSWTTEQDGISSMSLSPDGRTVATGGADTTIRLWDAETGSPIGEPLRGHEKVTTQLAFSGDGRRLASASEDETARLWDLATAQQIGQPLRHDSVFSVLSVAFSPDGRRLATGSTDWNVRLWDVESGHMIGEPWSGHDGWVSDLKFSPDGHRIASAGFDRNVILWDADTGEALGDPMQGHDSYVSSVAFNHDGTLIASGGSDGDVRLWDVATGYGVGPPLRAAEGAVYKLTFSPDGRTIVTAGTDATVRILPIPSESPDDLCSKLTRNMSRDAWDEWVSDFAYEPVCPDLPEAPSADSDTE